MEVVEGSMPYHGKAADGAWGPSVAKPLRCLGDRVTICFTSDSSLRDWGWRLAIKPEYGQVAGEGDGGELGGERSVQAIARKKDIFDQHELDLAAGVEAYMIKDFLARALFFSTLDELASYRNFVFETPRGPDGLYHPNECYVRKVVFPGAFRIWIEFDHNTCTEYLADRLEFFHSREDPQDICCIEIGEKTHPAVFSGPSAASDMGSTQMGPVYQADDLHTSGWPKCSVRGDRLLARFTSRGTRRAWGVKFTAVPEYPVPGTMDVEEVQRQLMLSAGFQALHTASLRKPHRFCDLRELGESTRTFAGLTLANLMGDKRKRQMLLEEQGFQWLIELLEHGSRDVQLQTMASLMGWGAAPSPVQNRRATLLSDPELTTRLMHAFVSMCDRDYPELRDMALQSLRGQLRLVDSDSMEAVLLSCLDAEPPSVRQEALRRVGDLAESSLASARKLLELRGVQRIKPFLHSDKSQVKLPALRALQRLLVEESAVNDLHDADMTGFAFLKDFLLSKDEEDQLTGLTVACKLLAKVAAGNRPIAAVVSHALSTPGLIGSSVILRISKG
jgi:hypothetical protein